MYFLLFIEQNKFQINKKLERKKNMKTTSNCSVTENSNIIEFENKKTFTNTNNLDHCFSSSLNTSNLSGKYGETKKKLEYNTKNNSKNKIKINKFNRTDNFQDLISNEEGLEIMKFLSPKLNKIKNKEQRLSNLYIKGKYLS